jgi:hypothetical protein
VYIYLRGCKNKKAGGSCPPPLHLGQAEVNHKVGIGDLYANFEGGLEADFIVVLGVPKREVFLVAQQVSSVEEIAEVRADDAVRSCQTRNSNYTDVCARVDDIAIGQPLQVNLVVHHTCVGFERSNQGAEVVPTAEDYEVIAGQDGLRNLVVDVVKYADDVAGCD